MSKKTDLTYSLILKWKKGDLLKGDILRNCLVTSGIKLENIVESIENNRSLITIFYNKKREALKAESYLKSLTLKGVDIALIELKDQDWQTLWLKEFKPFLISKNFKVIPYSYREKSRSQGKIPIIIDTTVAFGTGLHSTTRMMARFVDRCRKRVSSFLDIGAGTGILTIMALKSEIETCCAIEIDKDACKITRANIKYNGFDPKIVKCGNFKKMKMNGTYEFIAANIITDDLIDMRKELVKRVSVNGFLALSGISENNYHRFRKSFNEKNLRCLSVKKEEGWCAILYKRKY